MIPGQGSFKDMNFSSSSPNFTVPNFYRRMFYADLRGLQPLVPTTVDQHKPYWGLDLHRVEDIPILKGQGPDTDAPPRTLTLENRDMLADQLHPEHLSSGSLINAEEEFLEISGTDLPGVSLMLRNVPNRFAPILLMNLLFTNSRVTKDKLIKKVFQGPSLVAWWRMFSYYYILYSSRICVSYVEIEFFSMYILNATSCNIQVSRRSAGSSRESWGCRFFCCSPLLSGY